MYGERRKPKGKNKRKGKAKGVELSGVWNMKINIMKIMKIAEKEYKKMLKSSKIDAKDMTPLNFVIWKDGFVTGAAFQKELQMNTLKKNEKTYKKTNTSKI